MIKKHLHTCSVMLVLVVIFSLFICGKTVKKTVRTVTVNRPRTSYIFQRDEVPNDYSFANEAIPVNDKLISRRLRYSLMKHNHRVIQSDILQEKAEKLFPIIEPILKAYGIPDDFKYIPLVESGLKEGTSYRGAAGLWQFMPGTARTFGLKVNRNRDERLSVQKSTVAACKYIRDLYSEFNSWTLAAAAYNIGSIKLQKAINKQSEDNYFRMHFNHETGTYVYKLIAMKEIIEKPAEYGYKHYYHPQLEDLIVYN